MCPPFMRRSQRNVIQSSLRSAAGRVLRLPHAHVIRTRGSPCFAASGCLSTRETPALLTWSDPFGRRRDRLLRHRPRVGPASTLEAADRAHHHVVITENLARQADAGQAARGEPLPLCDGPARRLSLDKFNAAGGASGEPAARVHDVNSRVLFDRQDETLLLRDFKRSISFDGQIGHTALYGGWLDLQWASHIPDDLSGSSPGIAERPEGAGVLLTSLILQEQRRERIL